MGINCALIHEKSCHFLTSCHLLKLKKFPKGIQILKLLFPAPNESMAEVIMKTVTDAKEGVSAKLADRNQVLTLKDVQDNLDKLKGAIMIVYPMKLPSYDPVQAELDNDEDLSGTQVTFLHSNTPNTER